MRVENQALAERTQPEPARVEKRAALQSHPEAEEELAELRVARVVRAGPAALRVAELEEAAVVRRAAHQAAERVRAEAPRPEACLAAGPEGAAGPAGPAEQRPCAAITSLRRAKSATTATKSRATDAT